MAVKFSLAVMFRSAVGKQKTGKNTIGNAEFNFEQPSRLWRLGDIAHFSTSTPPAVRQSFFSSHALCPANKIAQTPYV
jgi:hypothetical protein